jgi:thiamine-phosphate pyrophosphorylase
MREVHRILDANFNRAREALRVAEDCGRFALNDSVIAATAKSMRSDLAEVYTAMPVADMLAGRDTAGDLGTGLTSPTEQRRADLHDVAAAACKRLTEALRTIEEYSKIVSPEQAQRVERIRYNAYTLEQRLMSRLAVGRRFADVRLYVLITPGQCRGSVRETAQAAIAGGAGALQLRAKDVSDATALAMATELRELCDATGTLLIVNDRADIAAIVGADGLHVGQDDLPIAPSRRLLRPGAIIGRSTHSVEQALAAVTEGADYIGVGPMFATTTKDYTPVGVEMLRAVAAAVTVPIAAIGGITSATAGEVFAAGASCVAVSSAVCAAADPKAAATAIRKAGTVS